jgi:hypothetical protein
MKRILSWVTAMSCAAALAAAPGASRRADWVQLQAAATGLGINVPVVGRLVGSGSVLFKSSLDVTNVTGTAAQVDFYVDLTDLTTNTPISASGSISSTGALVAQGTGGTVKGRYNAHYDDFIDSLVQAGFVDASAESDGVVGSVLLVFNGFSKPGQGYAAARFYNSLAGGTVGVAVRGHEISSSEPTKIAGPLVDSRGSTTGPQVYGNVFINNTGLTPTGSGSASAVDIQVAAFSATSGASVGTPITIHNVVSGQTAIVSDAFATLKVPSSEKSILVTATVVSGNAAIEGLVVQVDNTTKDSSGNFMARFDF